MNLSDSKKKLALAGVVCGIVAACLAALGNPANMAFCIACFIRDTAGAMGMHQAEVVQYARPEIIGLVLGAFIISVATKEYRSTAGSSPMIRFVLGVIIMIGALVFLGCPLRMVIRMSAGDLNAWVAFVGFILGVGTGVFALKNGFSLGNVHCGICSSSCRWMPASSADPCRAGFFGFGCNGCRNVCRICNLP